MKDFPTNDEFDQNIRRNNPQTVEEFRAALWSARFAMLRALDALESDSDRGARSDAFCRIQDEFDGVGEEEQAIALTQYGTKEDREYLDGR